MKVIGESIELDKPESDLLVCSVPNEVINGFRLQDFAMTIGATEEQFKSMVNELRVRSKNDKLLIDRKQKRLFGNALSATLKKLGTEEFETRTGCGFVEGQKALQDLVPSYAGSREVQD